MRKPPTDKILLTEKLRNFLTGPFVFSLPFTLILIILLPVEFTKFKLSAKKVESTASSTLIYYAKVFPGQLNSELFFANYHTNANLTLYSNDGRIVETYNFPGFWDESFPFQLKDIDGDSIPEFFCLTINQNDSIFISMVDFNGTSAGVNHRFLTSVRKHNGNKDHEHQLLEILDNNGDGFPEVLACVSAGYKIQPRKVYAWDFLRDSIYSSPNSGIKINAWHGWDFYDLDKDGVKEIFFTNSGVNNISDSTPYSDSATWLAVLGKNLGFYREPVYIKGRQSVSRFKVLEPEGMEPLILAHITDLRSRIRTRILLFDKELQIKDTVLVDDPDHQQIFITGLKSPLFIDNHNEKAKVFELDLSSLSLRLLKILPFPQGSFQVFDLNEDKKEEFIITQRYQSSSELIIIGSDLNEKARVKIQGRIDYPPTISVKEMNPEQKLIMYDAGQEKYLLTYNRNPYYPLRFILPLCLYIMITALFLIFQKIIVNTTLRRKEAHDKLQTYQLQAVMNQLNPHFTFNAINSIGHAILTGHKEEAHSYFVKLSSLIRKTMYNALSPVKTLDEEIEFVKEYLEIEEYRHSGKLKWNLEVDDRVNKNVEIPKMLIQIFTENSVKHGLLHKEGTGKIEIHIHHRGDNQIGIEITDDGVGRERAAKIVQSKGKGLKIFKNYIDIYNKRFDNFISFSLEDLYPHKVNKGTKINIDIFIRENRKK